MKLDDLKKKLLERAEVRAEYEAMADEFVHVEAELVAHANTNTLEQEREKS